MINIKNMTIITMLLCIVSCSTYKTDYQDVSMDKVVYKKQQLSKLVEKPKEMSTIQCFNNIIKNNPQQYAVVVDSDIILPSYKNDNLMNRGDVLFDYYLKKIIPDTQGIVVDSLPLLFGNDREGKTGKNLLGFLNADLQNAYSASIYQYLSRKRKVSELDGLIQTRVYKITGVFTRNDGKYPYAGIDNMKAKYNEDSNNSSLTRTSSLSTKVMELTVKIIDANNGYIKDIESFQVNYDSKRKRYRIGFGKDDLGLSSSFSTTVTDSPESAQDALIQASTIWAVNKFFDDRYEEKLKWAVNNNNCKK